MRPVSPYTVVQPNILTARPVSPALPGQGATEAVLGNPAAGYVPAVAAALGQPQGFASPGTTAPDYGLLAGSSSSSSSGASGSASGASGSGACGCG